MAREIIHPNHNLIQKIKRVWQLLKKQIVNIKMSSFDDTNKKFEFKIRYQLPDTPEFRISNWKITMNYRGNEGINDSDYKIYLLDKESYEYLRPAQLTDEKKIPIKFQILNVSEIPEDFHYLLFDLEMKILYEIKRNFETYLIHDVYMVRNHEFYNFIDLTNYN